MTATRALLAALILLPAAAQAQQSTEDRMRDALRQAVTEMRAAQDQQAQAQSDLAKAQADKAALQTQLDAANAKLAEQQAKPAAQAPAVDSGLQERLRAAEAQNAALQQRSAALQGSVQTALDQARQREDESRNAAAALQGQGAALAVCKTYNAKLIDVAEQILHLYQTESFRMVLLKSYEPVLGMAKVKLENTVQDYDDKIQDQAYIPPAKRAR